MAKFKRFENGSPKRRERRREDFDQFESKARREHRAHHSKPTQNSLLKNVNPREILGTDPDEFDELYT